MKKSYKQLLVIAVLALILSSTAVFAATTATQNVVLSITETYTGVAAIRVFDGSTTNPTVTFSDSYTGAYTVSTAGLEASTSAIDYGTLDEQSGGYLQYTVRGYNETPFKITVHSATTGYSTESLYVKSSDAVAGSESSVTATLGTVVTAALDANGGLSIAQDSGNAKDIITDISGNNTFTGTTIGTGEDAKFGAPLTYGFASAPGVSTIAVTYTILATEV